MRVLVVLAVTMLLCEGSIEERYRLRLSELEASLAAEQKRTPPLIVAHYGPDDVAEDGSMEGHELAWMDRLMAARARDSRTFPSDEQNPYRIGYAVYNLKHPRVVQKLLDARKAGIVVQVLVDASKMSSSRYKVDDDFKAIGVPVFKDREFFTPDATKRSLFAGIKVGSLMHNKMRLIQFPEETVLLTGSLNPGVESMENDESIYIIRDRQVVTQYQSFFDRLMVDDNALNERTWPNQFNPAQPLNVMFSPSNSMDDVASKLLDWIDQENDFIFVTMFSINLFGDRQGRNVLDALAAAGKRGALVWVVTDRKQSDGDSGFGRPYDEYLRKNVPGLVMYEVINDVGMFNAMHLKDVFFFNKGKTRLVTDTTNWSNAALGSCETMKAGKVIPKTCTRATSTESMLFVDVGPQFGFRVLKQHLGLLDKYYRQIPIQGTSDPSPEQAWQTLITRLPDIPFRRTVILVHCPTRTGEFVELRGGLCTGTDCNGTPEISYPNQLNGDTAPLKRSYRKLSWEQGAALDWTSDQASASGKSYINNGFGESPENKGRGAHWWKFLAYVDGKQGQVIEFKLVKTNGVAGPVVEWEGDVGAQDKVEVTDFVTGAVKESPSSASKNHRGFLGYVNRATFVRKHGSSART